METRKIDKYRRWLYKQHKKTKIAEQQEIAYDEFGDYEIITMHIVGKCFETYKSFAKCGLRVLEKYNNKIDAIAGHIKWCMRGEFC